MLSQKFWCVATLLVTIAASVPRGFAEDSSPVVAPVTVDRVAFIRALTKFEFAKLDGEISSIEKQAEEDPRFEMNVIAAFAAFETTQSVAFDQTEKWTKASPDSYVAAAARASCLIETGYRWQQHKELEKMSKFFK